MPKGRILALALLLAFGAAACGSDDTTGPIGPGATENEEPGTDPGGEGDPPGTEDPPVAEGDPLQADEAAILMEVLSGHVVLATGSIEAGFAQLQAQAAEQAAAGPALAPVTVNEQTSGMATCPLGGSLSVDGTVSGTVDDETGELDLDVSLDMSHDDCRSEHEVSGTQFTLSGDPSLAMDMGMAFSEADGLEMAGTMEGWVSWSISDGREGSCAIDLSLEFDIEFDPTHIAASIEGQVCGHSVSESVTAS